MANLRNRKLVIVIRILLGLMFLGSGASGLAGGPNMTGVPEPMVPILHTLWQSGIFQMIKITEIIGGLMLIVGFLPQLAAIFVAPICVGVIVFNLNVAPQYVVSAFVISALDIFLGYAYWDKYKTLFQK